MFRFREQYYTIVKN